MAFSGSFPNEKWSNESIIAWAENNIEHTDMIDMDLANINAAKDESDILDVISYSTSTSQDQTHDVSQEGVFDPFLNQDGNILPNPAPTLHNGLLATLNDGLDATHYSSGCINPADLHSSHHFEQNMDAPAPEPTAHIWSNSALDDLYHNLYTDNTNHGDNNNTNTINNTSIINNNNIEPAVRYAQPNNTVASDLPPSYVFQTGDWVAQQVNNQSDPFMGYQPDVMPLFGLQDPLHQSLLPTTTHWAQQMQQQQRQQQQQHHPFIPNRPLPTVAPRTPLHQGQTPLMAPQQPSRNRIQKRGPAKRNGKGKQTSSLPEVGDHQQKIRKVTSYSCDNCRASKTQCGGDGTNACQRCTKRNSPCIYSHVDKRTKGTKSVELEAKYNDYAAQGNDLLTILNLVRPSSRHTISGKRAAALWTEQQPPALIFGVMREFGEDNVYRKMDGSHFPELYDVVKHARKQDLPTIREALRKLEGDGHAMLEGLRNLINTTIEQNKIEYSWAIESSIHDCLYNSTTVEETRRFLEVHLDFVKDNELTMLLQGN
jgi:hypothetical protein